MSEPSELIKTSQSQPSFDLFDLPLELREMVYEHLEMPRAASARFWDDGKFNLTGQWKRVQYDWLQAAEYWTDNIMWGGGSNYGMTKCVYEIGRCLRDADLYGVLDRMPKYDAYVSYHAESWLAYLEEVENLKVMTAAMILGKLFKFVRMARIHLKTMIHLRDSLRATRNLLSTNRQLSNEVRTAIAKHVRHWVYLHEGELHRLDSHYFPIADALRDVRIANIECNSKYERDVVKMRGDTDLVAHLKRVADVARFMPFLKTLKFNMACYSDSHDWTIIKDEVKSMLLNTLITGREQLNTLEVKFKGKSSNFWYPRKALDMHIKLEKKNSGLVVRGGYMKGRRRCGCQPKKFRLILRLLCRVWMGIPTACPEGARILRASILGFSDRAWDR